MGVIGVKNGQLWQNPDLAASKPITNNWTQVVGSVWSDLATFHQLGVLESPLNGNTMMAVGTDGQLRTGSSFIMNPTIHSSTFPTGVTSLVDVKVTPTNMVSPLPTGSLVAIGKGANGNVLMTAPTYQLQGVGILQWSQISETGDTNNPVCIAFDTNGLLWCVLANTNVASYTGSGNLTTWSPQTPASQASYICFGTSGTCYQIGTNGFYSKAPHDSAWTRLPQDVNGVITIDMAGVGGEIRH